MDQNNIITTNPHNFPPQPILFNIYKYLDTNDLFNCALTNKHFNKLFNSDILWNTLICKYPDPRLINNIKKNYNVVQLKDVYRIIKELLNVNSMLCLNRTLVDLIDLREIRLYGSELVEIPPKIGLLTNLKYIYSGYNLLTRIPKEIGLLTNLQGLYLENNLLTEIPSEIGSLINLQKLLLYNNRLTEIPKEIGLLVKLRELHLDRNQLIKIPPEIGLLTNLEKLYLNDNKLTERPKELDFLINLQVLTLGHNLFNTE